MGRALRPGEEVQWNMDHGKIHGMPKRSRPGKMKASAMAPADPDYTVEDDKSGKRLTQRRSTSKKP